MDVCWSSAIKIVSLVVSCKSVKKISLVVASPADRLLLVAVSAATEAQSLSVAVARLVMPSTVSC